MIRDAREVIVTGLQVSSIGKAGAYGTRMPTSRHKASEARTWVERRDKYIVTRLDETLSPLTHPINGTTKPVTPLENSLCPAILVIIAGGSPEMPRQVEGPTRLTGIGAIDKQKTKAASG